MHAVYVRPSDRTTLERLGKSLHGHALCCCRAADFGTNAIQRARLGYRSRWLWRSRQKAYMDGGTERLLKDRGKGPRAEQEALSVPKFCEPPEL